MFFLPLRFPTSTMAMIITAFLASTALGAPVEKVARRPSLFGKLGSHIANGRQPM